MRVFKTSYRDKNGEKKMVAKWWIELRDHLQTVRRFPAFEDKRQSEALGRQIQKLINYKMGGEIPDAGLAQWLENIPKKLSQRFEKIGLLDSRRLAAGVPLQDHLEDFQQSLSAKGNTKEHVKLVTTRAKRTIQDCKFMSLSDISASRVERHLADLRDNGNGISAQTSNFYLAAIKQFCRWAVQDRRLTESPVQHLKGLNVRTDRRHDRRALEPDEIRRLLEATQSGPDCMGATGPERALLYQVAIETGLRAGELRSLTVSSFDLDNCTVCLEAEHSKHRREDILPLRVDTAELLKTFLGGKLPIALAFRVPDKPAKMLRADLAEAGIQYVDDSGRYVDFHSLRHTTGSLLAASGVHPAVAQRLMRHCDISLTMNKYTHIFAGQESEAIAGLPDLSLPSRDKQEAKATGTDAVKVIPDNTHKTAEKNLALNLALLCGKQRISVDNYGQTVSNGGENENAENSIQKAKNADYRPKTKKKSTGARSSARIEHRFPKPGVRGSSPLGRSFSRKLLSFQGLEEKDRPTDEFVLFRATCITGSI
jgi:integrase